MNPNTDFLKERGEPFKGNFNKKTIKQVKPSKDDLKDYPEYYGMNEYQRRCLVSTNYFRVLQGKREIPVPASDLHYHKYFDKRCYDLSEDYRKLNGSGGTFTTKTAIIEEKPVVKKNTDTKNKFESWKNAELAPIVEEKPVSVVDVIEKVIEPKKEEIIEKPVLEVKKDENIDFKEKSTEKPVSEQKTVEKEVKKSKSKTAQNSSNDSQIDLFLL